MYQALVLFVDLLCIFYAVWFIRELLVLNDVTPFIRTRRDAADEIAEHIGTLPPHSLVYDLGCGDGRVLRAIARRNPNVRFIGMDIRWLPYLLAQLRTRHQPNVVFERGDFFQRSLSGATHIYTYLYSPVMDQLLPKLDRELRSGTKLYSLDFRFSTKKPIEQLVLESGKGRELGTVLRTYAF